MSNLIAYYSRKGANYVSGEIVNLPIGNTEIVANKIKDMVGGDLFEIETKQAYSADYHECTREAQKELRENARPALAETLKNIDEYDNIFLGFPNWWGTMPMAVFTFLDGYDLTGKKIIPFCTHEGSGLGSSEKDIKNLYQKADLQKGFAIHGSKVSGSDLDIKMWLEKLRII